MKKAKSAVKMLWSRSLITFTIMLVIFAYVFFVLFQHTIINADQLRQQAENQQLSDVEVQAKRGNIYDCKMNVLATSATVWQTVIRPSAVQEEDINLIAGLSSLIGTTAEKLTETCKEKISYARVGKKLESETTEKVREYIDKNKLTYCIDLEETSKRYYPNDNLVSTVIGFTGTDGDGLEGLEYEYNDYLAGENGRIVAARDSTGGEMPFAYEKIVDAKAGDSVVTTIDEYIQYVVEKYLNQAVEQNGVKERGCCIVMDVNTGGILAMASKPDFNPNEPFAIYDAETKKKTDSLTGDAKSNAIAEARSKQWRNKCVSDTYEPGSVFKIITGSAAIEENAISLKDSYYCPGYITIADRTIHCHNSDGHGTQSLAEAYMNSCNPAFISIGQKLGVTRFTNYRKAFGLENLTGIDLPGETTSIVHEASSMGAVELASESFGQSFSITPIQLITAVSAAVNGGYLYQPHIAKQIIDANGNIVKNFEAQAKRQVISAETSKNICEFLNKVVSDGTGKNAYVAGFRVGGKTGTSEKLSSESGEGRIASFGAVAPTDAPQIAVLMLLDEPSVANPYGGTLCGPPVGKILEEILPYLGVSPEYTAEEAEKLAIETPDVSGKSVSDAEKIIGDKGLKAAVIGEGEKVVKQVPQSGAQIPHEGKVIIYTDNSTESEKVTVPDFSGMTVSEANELAVNSGLNIMLAGAMDSSTAYNQSVAKETEVERGTVITVSFRENVTVE